MENTGSITSLVLKAVAVAMAVAVVVLGLLGAVTAEASITLLGIGLFALALEALRQK
jgi:hypothetical protein